MTARTCGMCPAFLFDEASLACGICFGCRSLPAQQRIEAVPPHGPTITRPRVYIAGPVVKGDLGQNIEQAQDAMFKLMEAGFAPFCPMLSCFAGPLSRDWQGRPIALAEVLPRNAPIEYWYETDLAWVAVAEALLRLPGEGTGSDAEVQFARERGIPVLFSIADLVAHFKGA